MDDAAASSAGHHDADAASCSGVKTALKLVFARGAGLPAALVDEAFDSSREEWGREHHDLRAVMEALFAIAPEVRGVGGGGTTTRAIA